MNDVIKTVIQFVTTGTDKAVAGITSVKNAAGVATRSMATLATSLGSMGGSLGKAVGQAANFVASIQQMGAIGGIIAGAQLAITAISNHFIEAADRMVRKAQEMGDRIRSNLDGMNKARMDGVKAALDEATTKAREAADAFDALASSYLKVQQAQNESATSGDGAASSALALEKAKAMAAASGDGQRALVGADYDVRIAQANAKAVRERQDRAVALANDEAEVRSRQASDAAEAERKALKAKDRAAGEYRLDVESGNEGNLEKSRLLKEAADKAYADAVNARIRKEAEATAASERARKANNERTAAINDATRAVIEARDAERRLVAAQTEAAKAEIERLNAAEKSVEANGGEGTRRPTGQPTADYASKFETAFDLWRDPEAAARAVDADKKRSSDMKAFNRAVNRYGGKGKIDEYAALMREGDEEGMQSRLEQWRKSSKFTPQVEQMVKAEAARQNESASERALQNIEKNTSNLDKKLDQLLAVK